MESIGKCAAAPLTWRLRVQLDDSPGALARVTIRLAERNCNVLALSVIPVPGGVIDELVVQVAPGLLPADLVESIRAEGGRCVGITVADLRDLVDAPTAALRAAGNAVRNPGNVCDALRAVLAADSVVVLSEGAQGEIDDEHPGHPRQVGHPRRPGGRRPARLVAVHPGRAGQGDRADRAAQ